MEHLYHQRWTGLPISPTPFLFFFLESWLLNISQRPTPLAVPGFYPNNSISDMLPLKCLLRLTRPQAIFGGAVWRRDVRCEGAMFDGGSEAGAAAKVPKSCFPETETSRYTRGDQHPARLNDLLKRGSWCQPSCNAELWIPILCAATSLNEQ